jgi:choline kinase
MRAVILCAGLGSRFGQHTYQEHKLLLPVNGVPIIDYTLRAFSLAGFHDVGLVTGFMSDRLVDWVGDGARYGLKVEYFHNPDYKLGNALSIRAAQPFTRDEPFILSMGDHLVSSNLITRVQGFDGNRDTNALGVDFDWNWRDELDATRVQVEPGGRISAIGKQITKWNGVDSGVFRFNREIYAVLDQWIALDKSKRYEMGDALAYMVSQGGLIRSCDISQCFWHDVDSLDDIALVESSVVGFDK